MAEEAWASRGPGASGAYTPAHAPRPVPLPWVGHPPTGALLSPPLPGHLQRDLLFHSQSVACVSLERSLASAAPGPRTERKAPRSWQPLSPGAEFRRLAADGGGPSGAHVDEFLGGNHVPSAVARCHPVFSPPSESLNFAHLS